MCILQFVDEFVLNIKLIAKILDISNIVGHLLCTLITMHNTLLWHLSSINLVYYHHTHDIEVRTLGKQWLCKQYVGIKILVEQLDSINSNTSLNTKLSEDSN